MYCTYTGVVFVNCSDAKHQPLQGKYEEGQRETPVDNVEDAYTY